MDTDINSHADETFMESYQKIPPDDLSRFLLASNIILPQLLSHSLQYLQVFHREDLLYREFLTLNPYANITRDSILFYQI